jgi:Asp-tRNA(Asn)/Glu-tRNA(Gln) amidotransferase A subunit family amidase
MISCRQLQKDYVAGSASPVEILDQALQRANSNAGRNVYLALDADRVRHQAAQLPERFSSPQKPAVYGFPVSLKDCFDLRGFGTSCGSRFYAAQNPVATIDSAVAARLRSQGALIVGKAHLHQLAYGITGENPDYGDCLQPAHPLRLTGGSSSGGAAGVQEGSAIAAIGTDTGGSIRVPAVLCGLAGYRASIELAYHCGLWRGGIHLAPSFDTLGWLFREVADGPLLASALFGLEVPTTTSMQVRVGSVHPDFLQDCQSVVLEFFANVQRKMASQGAQISTIDSSFWDDAMDIFAPIQSHEAAAIHTTLTGGDFSHFEKSIAERLTWGASLSRAEIEPLRKRHEKFRAQMDTLLLEYDFLIVPCAPVHELLAGADHSQTRRSLLRYTVPMSLAGVPVVTLPSGTGAGVQLVAARGSDAKLLAYAAQLGPVVQPSLPAKS